MSKKPGRFMDDYYAGFHNQLADTRIGKVAKMKHIGRVIDGGVIEIPEVSYGFVNDETLGRKRYGIEIKDSRPKPKRK